MEIWLLQSYHHQLRPAGVAPKYFCKWIRHGRMKEVDPGDSFFQATDF